MPIASHSKPRPSLDSRPAVSSTVQPDLFSNLDEQLGQEPEHVDLDMAKELIGALTFARKQALRRRIDVDRIADRMNPLLDEDNQVTKRQLYAWLAESREGHRFPAEYIPAFCAATGCYEPLRVLANALQLDLVDDRELLAKEVGENVIQTARLRRQRNHLTRRLGV